MKRVKWHSGDASKDSTVMTDYPYILFTDTFCWLFRKMVTSCIDNLVHLVQLLLLWDIFIHSSYLLFHITSIVHQTLYLYFVVDLLTVLEHSWGSSTLLSPDLVERVPSVWSASWPLQKQGQSKNWYWQMYCDRKNHQCKVVKHFSDNPFYEGNVAWQDKWPLMTGLIPLLCNGLFKILTSCHKIGLTV